MKKDKLTLAFVAVTILIATYLIFFVDKLYLANSTITINNTNESKVDISGMISFGSATTTQEKDSRVLISYLKSYEVAKALDKHLNISKEFQNRINPFNSLSKNFTKEEFLEMYNKSFTVLEYDPQSGIISIQVAYSNKELTKKVAVFLTNLGEKKMNDYGFQLANKHLAFAENLVAESKKKLTDSEQKILTFQSSHVTIDPKVEIETKTGLISTLEGELAKKKSELHKLNSFMSNTSPEVELVKADIQGIKGQISSLKSSIAGNSNKKLNIDLYDFNKLKSDVDFNKELYKQALIQYELAREEAVKQSKSLTILSDVEVTDEAIYPNTKKALFITFILMTILFSIVSTIRLVIKEHQH